MKNLMEEAVYMSPTVLVEGIIVEAESVAEVGVGVGAVAVAVVHTDIIVVIHLAVCVAEVAVIDTNETVFDITANHLLTSDNSE